MLTFPNAKINIGLFITQKREDGYHNLETIFYPVKQLKDALEIVPASGPTGISLSGLTVAGSEKNNLVWKAYELIQKRMEGQLPAIRIFLQKAIPMGAGLGGGSADGAFMLRLLNDYYKLGIEVEELAAMSLQLGSDCPFFMYNTPQFAVGRGERMVPISLDLSGYDIRLVHPRIHVATKEAFSRVQPGSSGFDLRQLSADDITNWKNYVVNDFEAPVLAQHPVLQKIKQQLYDEGAIYASMSGSGSSFYGIFKKNK
ncbi:MAG TPA: 4-(cytidine 5'-diphospho)-2-C-methyl-D-erythritol kinase [Flavipsychrobacter sp.]|nr:4-(cytidine 5'-diphospho)-2-C-methyl-D-erythritol kinase [Flavipsychrobacter sp.]